MYFKYFHLTDINFSKQLVKPRKHYSRLFDNLTMTCSKLPDVWVWITWKCLCPEKYNSWGSMCGLLISVDVPSIAPTVDGNLFQLPIFQVHSSSEGQWTNAWKCSHIIGIHQLIASCIVVTLTSKSKERRWYDGYERIHSMNNITWLIGDNLCGRPVAWNMSLLSCQTISRNVSGVSSIVSKNEYLLNENIWNTSLP
jgi:hypothetical protein